MFRISDDHWWLQHVHCCFLWSNATLADNDNFLLPLGTNMVFLSTFAIKIYKEMKTGQDDNYSIFSRRSIYHSCLTIYSFMVTELTHQHTNSRGVSLRQETWNELTQKLSYRLGNSVRAVLWWNWKGCKGLQGRSKLEMVKFKRNLRLYVTSLSLRASTSYSSKKKTSWPHNISWAMLKEDIARWR